jgi:hypothetical protein
MDTELHLPKTQEDTLPAELPAAEVRRRLATYIPQKGDNTPKFMVGLDKEKVVINAGDVTKQTTIFIATCRDTEVTVNAMCTKIMMQGCARTKLICNGVVLTNSVEIWNCEDIELEINEVLIATLQVDMLNKFSLNLSRKKLFHKMIWAAVQDYTISFRDDAETTFRNGYQTMVARYPGETFQEKITQFIDSVEEGKVRSEKLMRLQNGFPTTEREQEEFDEKSEQNRKLAEEHYRGLVDKVSKDEDLKKLGIKTIKKGNEGKKMAKPNDPCPCHSGAKYKKCCGNPAKVAQAEKEKEEKEKQNEKEQKKE